MEHCQGRCLLTDVETGEETATSVLEYRHRVMSETLPDGTRLGVDWHLQHPGDYLDVLRITIRARNKNRQGLDRNR